MSVQEAANTIGIRKVVSRTIKPRVQGLENARRKAFHYFRNRRMSLFINLFKKIGFSSLYRKLNDDKKEIKELSREEYLRVYPAFADDLEKFADRAGLDLGAWKPPEK